MSEYYDIAQICLNGHMVNDASRGLAEHNEKFCSKCGAQTITACPRCSDPLPGQFQEGMWAYPGRVRSFCRACGAAYPWTASALSAARLLTEELEGLTPSERVELSNSLDDLVQDTPMSQVAALRFKKLMAKSGAQAAALMKNILYAVAAEAVKQSIWPKT